MDQRTELDSHADTSVVGKESALIIHDYKTPVHVHGYTEEVGHRSNCCIFSAVFAYVHPEKGDVLTENAQKGSLVDCQEDVSYTALTIVCTINVSIDCDCFDVSNPSTRKNIHKRKSSQ